MSADREEQGTRRMMTGHKELVVPASIDTVKAKYLSVQSDQEPGSAASSVRSGVTSASASSSTYSGREVPYMGPHGWILPSQFRERSASRSSAASATSCRTDETPLTPMSAPDDDALALDLSQLDVKLEEPQPMFPMPFRPKHKTNRESWDSALGSDFSGRRRRHIPSASLSGTSDYSSIRSLSLDERDPAAVARSIKNAEPMKSHTFPVTKEAVNSVADRPYLSSEESDSDETVSDETVSNETIPPKDASRRVLNYTLDVVFGLAIDNVTQVSTTCRSVVDNFISDMAWAVDQESGKKQVPRHDCTADLSRLPTNISTSSSGTSSSQRSSTRSDKGKRKSRDGGDDDQDGDDECDDEPKRRGAGPSKRPKLDPVRLSCPFRKKNPLRFNVRDHRLCALTVFTDTAELRRHIQDLHRRPALPYQCLRCQSQFSTQGEFGDHLRSVERCPLIETPLGSNDPEDGIDESVVKILRSKKGRVSDPVEVQWQKIWELLFPGTPVQPYDYCAVMEHFELYEKYRSSLPHLRTSLSRIGLGERGLESLSNILNNHFIGLFEQCNEEGRQKDYRNRQPKPQQSQLRPKRRSFRERVENKAHRDSGVDVGMEDEVADEDLLAKTDDPEDNTPSFGTEAGDALVGQLQPSDEHVGGSGFDGFSGLEPAVFADYYRDMTFPAETVTTALDGGYNPGYTTQPSDNADFRTKSGIGSGALPEDSFGYHCSQDNPNQLGGEWGLGSTGLGFSEPMTDLNAWVYGQHERR